MDHPEARESWNRRRRRRTSSRAIATAHEIELRGKWLGLQEQVTANAEELRDTAERLENVARYYGGAERAARFSELEGEWDAAIMELAFWIWRCDKARRAWKDYAADTAGDASEWSGEDEDGIA